LEPKTPTLDQIAVFQAVVESGSFTGAARRLGRAPSVVSYAITNLENQLGVILFARAGTARPKLTAAGQAILADSRALTIAVDGLLAKARGLTSGLEAEVALVVDVTHATDYPNMNKAQHGDVKVGEVAVRYDLMPRIVQRDGTEFGIRRSRRVGHQNPSHAQTGRRWAHSEGVERAHGTGVTAPQHRPVGVLSSATLVAFEPPAQRGGRELARDGTGITRCPDVSGSR